MKSQISTFTFFFLFLPTFILILEDFSLKKYFPIFPIWFITKWIFLLCIKYQMHRKSHFHHPKWAMQIHNERQAWDELFSELQITLKRNHLKSSHKNANPFEQRNIRCRRRHPLSLLQRSQSPPSQTFGLEHHHQGAWWLSYLWGLIRAREVVNNDSFHKGYPTVSPVGCFQLAHLGFVQ